MKLKINKACDLSSISVLPPHSRRGNAIPPGADTSIFGKSQGSSQFRSHSQQSFSQGMSMSQLSQNSQEEIVTNEHRFGSQDNSLKRISCLVPVTYTREDTQMLMSRSSNNVICRWSSTSAPNNRCGPHCAFAMAQKSSGWLKMKKYPTVLFLQSSVHESEGLLIMVDGLNFKDFVAFLSAFSSHGSLQQKIEHYSVGQFFEDARRATRDIIESGRVPIVAGGTGLYLRWYIYGKPDVPKASLEITSEVYSELMILEKNEDWDAAVQLVMKAGDPKAQFVAVNDWYRLRRSLEIIKWMVHSLKSSIWKNPNLSLGRQKTECCCRDININSYSDL